MPCSNLTLQRELGSAAAGVCAARSCAPLNARGSPRYCYQLPPSSCERHVVKVAFVLYSCHVQADEVLGVQCKKGPPCLEGIGSNRQREPLRSARWSSTLGSTGRDESLAPGLAGMPATRRAVVWQAENNWGSLRLMYKPIVQTLVDGLHALADANHWTVEAQIVPNTSISRLRRGSCCGMEKLQKGSIFVWVGDFAAEEVPWAELRRRGVRTVYYQTEPHDLPCELWQQALVDEIWDYSRQNIALCSGGARRDRLRGGQTNGGAVGARTFRYVPPGLQRMARAQQQSSATLAFLGLTKFGRRPRCMAWLQEHLGDRLRVFKTIWTPAGLADTLRHHGMHLNLHKECGDENGSPHGAGRLQPLELVRLSTLLSAGVLVISESSSQADEAEFAGLCTFAPLGELPNRCADEVRLQS